MTNIDLIWWCLCISCPFLILNTRNLRTRKVRVICRYINYRSESTRIWEELIWIQTENLQIFIGLKCLGPKGSRSEWNRLEPDHKTRTSMPNPTPTISFSGKKTFLLYFWSVKTWKHWHLSYAFPYALKKYKYLPKSEV